ncbi:type 2 lanthipeptide synthetase LanM family protein [Actinophytocola sp.]|uniref:type 2 lanthipeptide synthetase LanM family protein n=1 Tax=Actinophytocola sp. TaxID=1872138 RepID=UPI002ED6BA7D
MTDTMPAGWWAPGLALAERPAGNPVSSGAARERLARWRAALGVRFGERLAADGLDENALLGLLAEPRWALAARVPRPDWAKTVERAVHAATPQQANTTDWRAAFAVPLRPFVTNAVTDLTTRAAAVRHIDLPAITAGFADRLSRLLVGIATRTLVHELNTRLAAGSTTGAADFATQLTEPTALAELCATYPVLARLLGQASTFRADAAAELLSRFAADRAALVESLCNGADPGRLTEVRAGIGDTHRHGRTVALLTFASGDKVVYKPRDLGTHERFTRAVGWLNTVVPDLQLRTAAAVARDGYGWVEFIPTRPLPDLAGADRFYRRHGGLLALLHALHAADMHFENVIACGDQPVPIDVETLFHPSLTTPDAAPDPAARVLSESVQRTGLLPVVVAGEGGAADVSAIGGSTVTDVVTDWAPDEHGALREVRKQVSRTGTGNLPTLAGRPVAVTDHEQALLTGFRSVYDAILRHRTEFIDLLEECGDDEVRVAVRHSAGYARLITESTRPELLRDGLARDHALDLLWTESTRHPLRWRVCREELADLWAGDVPLFTTRPGSADLWSAAGRRLPGALDRPGLADALTKVNAMSEIDRRDQEWIVTAALATTRPNSGHRPAPPLPGRLAGTAAPPDRLLVAACTIADQIVARHHERGERVNWLGLELVDDSRWMVLPMGAGLGNGYLGVALFLAQVAELSGIARYADMARRALRGLPVLFDLMARRPDLIPAVGCGGFEGFGGIAYGLARLTTLLGDPELLDATHAAVDLAAAAAKAPGPAGVADGAAGCLAAMTAVHTELGLAPAASLAQDCADGLTDLVRVTDLADTPSGFLAGTAGITWALGHRAPAVSFSRAGHARLKLTVDPSDQDPRSLVPCPRSTTRHDPPDASADLGWCAGTAGLVMAGASDLDPLVADRPVLADLSLCHGELGIVDALAGAGEATRRRRAGLILDAYTRHGATCGTPGGVTTPGLLTGLAGIGYGLLRLGFADRVPSVLLLEPTHH